MFKLTIALISFAFALQGAVATPLYEAASGIAIRDINAPEVANVKLDNSAMEAEEDGILDTIGSVLRGFGFRELEDDASDLAAGAADDGILDTLGGLLGSFGFRDDEGEDFQLENSGNETPDDGILDTLGGLLGGFGF